MHVPTDLDAFRESVAEALARGDHAAVVAAIHPAGHDLAIEHGAAFREIIGGLPAELWHDDPRIATQLGESYRSTGSPRGHAALGYFRAAEEALAQRTDASAACLASVQLSHAAALRNVGRTESARVKVADARILISTGMTDSPLQRVRLGARYSLENGMLLLDAGQFASAREHLEYAHGLASTHLSRAEHIELLGAIAKVDVADGHLERAETQIGYAKELADGTNLLQTGYGAPALTAEIWAANERFDLKTAIAREAGMLDAARGNEWEPHALAVCAQTAALRGRVIEALDLVERSLKIYAGWETTGFAASFALLLRAALLLNLDHAEQAWAILRNLEPAENHVLCPARITAQLRLTHGDLMGAEAAIEDCEALGELHCSRTVADVQLIRAAIETARGNLSGADVNTDRAFQAMARTGSKAAQQRIPPATLTALARRAMNRPQSAEVRGMVEHIVERASDHGRQSEPLSVRERLVLAQVQRGLTVAAIAAELYISPNTVKTHLRRLYRKLGVTTREEAISAARSLGLDQEITRDSPV